MHIPIHHTLENATITYDTVEQDFQKDLVKDVFFSPAMIHGREMSPSTDSSASSTCAQSDNESDDVSVTPPQFSTPSDLLLLDGGAAHLFDFGLDLATTSSTSNQTTTSSYEEVMMMAANKKKPAFTLSLKEKFDFSNQADLLPTPPADYILPQNKRRCSDSVLQDRMKKKQRLNVNSAAHLRSFHNNTPPASPMLSTLKHETIFESSCDYFDDASGEESSDDEHEQSNKRYLSNHTSMSKGLSYLYFPFSLDHPWKKTDLVIIALIWIPQHRNIKQQLLLYLMMMIRSLQLRGKRKKRKLPLMSRRKILLKARKMKSSKLL